MKILTAVENIDLSNKTVVFLAGGITNCKDWQKEVINNLKGNLKFNSEFYEDLVIANPRRENFPIHDPNASQEQIEWEFKMLEACDLFTMYFDGDTPSDQPICFYELGRNLVRMTEKYNDKVSDHVIITVDENFKRKQDVYIQSKLAGFEASIIPSDQATEYHSRKITEWCINYQNYKI